MNIPAVLRYLVKWDDLGIYPVQVHPNESKQIPVSTGIVDIEHWGC
jgi:hypothetical protein